MSQAKRKTAVLSLQPVVRGTLPDEIHRRIKNLILDGGIAPGELVTIQGLADAFNVSPMPVREALQRLTADKALTIVAGRSVGIPALKASRLRDLYRVRLEVETVATRWATQALTASDLERLEGLVGAMAEAIKEGSPRGFLRANHDFHFTIYRASGSDTLLSIIEGLWLQVSPYFHSLHGSGSYVASNRQHERALTALKQRDPAAAAASIGADLSEASQVLLDLLG
jgi:DNA-binding GntR family transcriptional regulator